MNVSQISKELGIPAEELRERKEKALDLCICPDCPSYVEGDAPVAYCFPTIGASDEITEEKGCLCAGCPVFEENDLQNGYYCTRGSEIEQTS